MPDHPFFLRGFQAPFCFTSASSSRIMFLARGCGWTVNKIRNDSFSRPECIYFLIY